MSKLTPKEIQAAKSSTFFKSGRSWGSSLSNLWPAGKIAQVRGAEFEQSQSLGLPIFAPVDALSDKISTSALRDISEWLGFDHSIKYLNNLTTERLDIFKRATY